MFNWLRRRTESEKAKDENLPKELDPVVRLQRSYWTFNAGEKAALLARYPEALSWPELLRLHHLTCLELLSRGEGQARLSADLEEELAAPEGSDAYLCRELTQCLLSRDSPYRTRYGLVWQGKAAQPEHRPPDLQGLLRNASLTHFGCLEAFHVDSQYQPQELSFIPFDDIRAVLFARPTLFRAAKVIYEDSRQEPVLVPLLYGISWFTESEIDHNGTFTRFIPLRQLGEFDWTGIGIGHQDFTVTAPGPGGQATLFGLGSVSELQFALDPEDPKFEQKCRGRGLDPSDVSRRMTGQ